MTDVIGNVTDVQKALTYGSGKLGRWFLQMGLTALAAGAFLVWLRPSDFGAFQWFMTGLALVVGAVSALYGFSRWRQPRPMLTLSPAGLRLHIEFVKTVLIPWSEIHGVDSIDISGRVGGREAYVPGVTVVLVTRAFYDRYIHVRSWLLRGPAWHMNFIPKDDMMQIALHHEIMSATALELRAAVEARWSAFRDAKPAVTESVGGGWVKRRV
jgi:hypothetical protein